MRFPCKRGTQGVEHYNGGLDDFRANAITGNQSSRNHLFYVGLHLG
jgi:hypothetical protein